MENQETSNIPQPKSILPIVITAIVSLSIGLSLGYFAGARRSARPVAIQNTQYTNNQVTPTISPSRVTLSTLDYTGLITPTPPPPKTITKIPGWLTYTNAVHKYIVQYPPDWIIDSSRADEQEDYQDSNCCNAAALVISKGETKWDFAINVLYTGFQAPLECEPGPDQCTDTRKNVSVLGYPLYRIIMRQNSSGKVVEAYIASPKENDTSHPGFGQVGITTPFAGPDHIKYFLDYSGPEIEKYLTILDRISESLQATE